MGLLAWGRSNPIHALVAVLVSALLGVLSLPLLLSLLVLSLPVLVPALAFVVVSAKLSAVKPMSCTAEG